MKVGRKLSLKNPNLWTVKIVWKSEISGDLQFELGGKSKDWGITLSAVFRDRVRLKKPSSPWVGTLVVLTYQFPASFWERFEWSEWHWIDTKSLWEKHRFEWSEWDRPLQRWWSWFRTVGGCFPTLPPPPQDCHWNQQSPHPDQRFATTDFYCGPLTKPGSPWGIQSWNRELSNTSMCSIQKLTSPEGVRHMQSFQIASGMAGPYPPTKINSDPTVKADLGIKQE